jgi:hypothetical protein
MTRHARFALAIAINMLLASGIIGAFWYQDWRYSFPTPRPADLVQQTPGSIIDVPFARPGGKPVFLHFLNPDCPCSRFNVDHVRKLIAEYGDRVRMVAVVEGEDQQKTLAGFERLNLDIETVYDAKGEMARRCGVYSTPQAVVLEQNGMLYYRGNYNASRYCTERNTEFARLSLESLFGGDKQFDEPAASTAYGCSLPTHKQ